MVPHSTMPSIPDFELLRRIGQGSYGEVWLARSVTGLFRAVKIVRRDSFLSERPYRREFEGVSRFVRVAAGEPSQLAVLHAGLAVDESHFFYVMELADDATRGREIDPRDYVPLTLDRMKEGGQRLPLAQCMEIALAIATGLATLHRQGLVHRDIKPSNIVLVGGVPKLADIGLVAVAEEGRTFVGTEAYVAPEGPGQPPADVFAVARVLYELWSGRPTSEWPTGLVESEKTGREDAEWAAVLLRAGDFVASRRHADASALRDDLLLVKAGKSVRRLRLAERAAARLRKVVAISAAVGAVAAVAAVAAIRFERQRAETANAARRQAEAERDALARRTVYAAQVAQAQRALENGDFGAARRHLLAALPERNPETLRGFEWQVLWRKAQGDTAHVLRAGGKPVDQIEVVDQGRSFWLVHGDGEAQQLDRADGHVRLSWPGVERLLTPVGDAGAVALLRDGQVARLTAEGVTPSGFKVLDRERVQTALVGGRVAVLDHHKPNRLKWVDPQTGASEALELPFSADGDWMLHRSHFSISDDGRLFSASLMAGYLSTAHWRWVVVDLRRSTLLLDAHESDWLGRVAVSPDGERAIATFPDRRQLKVWEAATEKISLVSSPHLVGSDDVRFESATWLSGRTDTGGLLQVDVRSGQTSLQRQGLSLSGPHGDFVGDGEVWGADREGRVLRWLPLQPSAKDPRPGFNLPAGSVPVAAVHPRGRQVVVGTVRDGVLGLPTDGGTPLLYSPNQHAIGFDASGDHLFLVTREGKIESHSSVTGVAAWSLPVFDRGALATSISPDGTVLAALSEAGELACVTALGEHRFVLKAHSGYATGLAVGPGGEWILTSGNDGLLRLWSGADGRLLAEHQARTDGRLGGYNDLVAVPGRPWVIGALDGEDSPAERIEVPSLVVAARYRPSGGAIRSLAVSPDAMRVVLTTQASSLAVLTADELSPLCELTGPFGDDVKEVATFAFARETGDLWVIDRDGRLGHVPVR